MAVVWAKTRKAGVIIAVTFFGKPAQQEVERERFEVKMITRYLAKCGHPCVIG